ncbi:MAG: SRPBCC family protein [Proteobacteria bacterium]|nr:SRPBCC family protein [Pseudomonadota bacterium]
MRLTAAIDIAAPAEIVWRCIDEPEQIVRWVEGAVEHRYLGPRDPAHPVGQKFVQRLKQGSKVSVFEGTLIAFERLRHFAFVIPSPAYSSEAHFRLSAQGPERTHVDYAIDVTLHTGKAKIAAALLRVPLGFFVKKQMRRLEALALSLHGAGA